MSDDQRVQADPKVEAKAAGMGWVPEDKFRGDKAKWVDASTFVERGEQFLPILQANNRRLQEDFGHTKAEVTRLNNLLEASQESIKELKKFHDENARSQVEAARTRLLAELKAAKKDGDTDLEVDLTDELSKVTAALAKETKREEPVVKKEETPAADPAFLAWQSQPENAWFGKDRRRTSMAIVVAQDLRASGDRSSGVTFFDKVSAEVAELFDGKGEQADESRGTSKVGSGRGAGGSDSSSGTSFKDLPKEAKDACEMQARQLVGEGRAFKTKAEWQTYYADQFFKTQG